MENGMSFGMCWKRQLSQEVRTFFLLQVTRHEIREKLSSERRCFSIPRKTRTIAIKKEETWSKSLTIELDIKIKVFPVVWVRDAVCDVKSIQNLLFIRQTTIVEVIDFLVECFLECFLEYFFGFSFVTRESSLNRNLWHRVQVYLLFVREILVCHTTKVYDSPQKPQEKEETGVNPSKIRRKHGRDQEQEIKRREKGVQSTNIKEEKQHSRR